VQRQRQLKLQLRMLNIDVARGRRIDGEPGTGWKTATEEQKSAWLMRIATICTTRHCSSFKSRPSSDCPRCGDSPVPVGTEHWKYDHANGWDWC
jgi:hypothetical protein